MSEEEDVYDEVYEKEDQQKNQLKLQAQKQLTLSPITEMSNEQNRLTTQNKNSFGIKEFSPIKEKSTKYRIMKAYTQKSSITVPSNPGSRKALSLFLYKPPECYDRKIVHDQINKSHSKQQFSFSKAKRFSKTTESYCFTQFYENQYKNLINLRSTSLGFGQKSDFTKSDRWIPGPTTYNAKSCFENDQKGIKFSLGRHELKKQGLLGNINKNPGPGAYEPKPLKTHSGYSLGERTKAKHLYPTSTTPSPGTYKIGGLHPKGSYFLNKFRSSGASVFSPTSSLLNLNTIRTARIPGPGTYDLPGDIQKESDHLPSRYNRPQTWKFGTDMRKTANLPHINTPGPGTYSIPSEFGDWEYPPIRKLKDSKYQTQLMRDSKGFQNLFKNT